MNIKETTVAYPNLRAEMARKGLKPKDIAVALDKSDDWVDARLRGRAVLPVGEALKIKKNFFPEINFEYLFINAVILPSEIKESL